MSNDRFYTATVSGTDAREAVKQWLTTGMTRVADSSLSITSCRLAYLPFSQFHDDYTVQWEADIGSLDDRAYNQAMNTYNVQYAHVQNMPANQRPTLYSPNKRDYIDWRHCRDTTQGAFLSPLHMTASPSAHGLDERIEDWANKVLEKITLPDSGFHATFNSWAQRGGDKQAFLTPPTDDVVVNRFSAQMEKAVRKTVKTEVKGYEYVENINCYPTHNCDITERLILPVYLVEYVVNGKQRVCLVDGFTATAVIGAKVRDFKGMFGRAFSEMFSGFKFWGNAPTVKG